MNWPISPRTTPRHTGWVSQPSVALVTLGCARNEVDSEELAGRLAADGFRLVDDPAAADTVLVNTCGFVEQAKKDSVDALLEAADLKGDGGPQSVVAVGCLAERYGAELADVAARGRRGARLRRLPRHRGAAAVDRGGGEASPAHAAGPAPAAADLAPSTEGRRHRSRRADPARVRTHGAAQAGLGLRPALHVLRDPVVPRLVREPPADRRPRRGPLAGCRRGPRAVPGQRELHVLRQGPRRPATPGDVAAGAGGRRRRRAGAGVLPPAGRDAARAARGDRDHARRGAVLRPLLPARQQRGAAADAPVRRSGELPRPARAGAVLGAGSRGALQRHRRLPR